MAGFQEAFQHRPAIQRYLAHMLGNVEEAEDLTQETFLRAHSKWATLHEELALLGWLYRIATNVAVDRLRQRVKTAAFTADRPAEELALPDEKAVPALKIVEQQEMSACVQRYVAMLPDEYRCALLLHDVEGFTAEELAELLALPLTTIKMRLHRARAKLQALLRDACQFESDERGVTVCEPSGGR
jgi:RNA polymerase sigma-70 factor (ECF subfamily)